MGGWNTIVSFWGKRQAVCTYTCLGAQFDDPYPKVMVDEENPLEVAWILLAYRDAPGFLKAMLM